MRWSGPASREPDRLDKAALGAVRRWRWSPTIVDGRPAQVKGFVRIPFELR
ncbi:energy transducer TonB [Sphingomonas sp. Leaf67]|uniref:energy transducer TonB n=1 Tax=Sphingomonas sp. Leaf67 TaxID=1736230 RepID=UPI002AA2B41E|nr:energy transducer TonB [Sphingomonas sp. Leaf67]